MNKQKIGIDIDEVVAGFMNVYLEFHNRKNNTSFNLESLTDYHLWKCGVHNSKEESIEAIMEFQNSPFFDDITLIDGAKSGIETLSKKYSVFFITSRPFELREKTERFFYNNFPDNGYHLIFSGEIYGGKTKAEICCEEKIKLMIEDNAEYALGCAKIGVRTFLFDKPWNKNYEKHDNLIKVNNWKEVLERI